MRVGRHDRHLHRAESDGVQGGVEVGDVTRQRLQRHEAVADDLTPVLETTLGGPSSMRAITGAFPAHNDREQEWAGALNPGERETLIALLQKLIAHSVDFEAKHRS